MTDKKSESVAVSEATMAGIETKTKSALKEQKKFNVMLPEKEGENFLEFQVNGVNYTVQRGVMVEVPETIYKLVENMKTQERMKKAMENRLINTMELHI